MNETDIIDINKITTKNPKEIIKQIASPNAHYIIYEFIKKNGEEDYIVIGRTRKKLTIDEIPLFEQAVKNYLNPISRRLIVNLSRINEGGSTIELTEEGYAFLCGELRFTDRKTLRTVTNSEIRRPDARIDHLFYNVKNLSNYRLLTPFIFQNLSEENIENYFTEINTRLNNYLKTDENDIDEYFSNTEKDYPIIHPSVQKKDFLRLKEYHDKSKNKFEAKIVFYSNLYKESWFSKEIIQKLLLGKELDLENYIEQNKSKILGLIQFDDRYITEYKKIRENKYTFEKEATKLCMTYIAVEFKDIWLDNHKLVTGEESFLLRFITNNKEKILGLVRDNTFFKKQYDIRKKDPAALERLCMRYLITINKEWYNPMGIFSKTLTEESQIDALSRNIIKYSTIFQEDEKFKSVYDQIYNNEELLREYTYEKLVIANSNLWLEEKKLINMSIDEVQNYISRNFKKLNFLMKSEGYNFDDMNIEEQKRQMLFYIDKKATKYNTENIEEKVR